MLPPVLKVRSFSSPFDLGPFLGTFKSPCLLLAPPPPLPLPTPAGWGPKSGPEVCPVLLPPPPILSVLLGIAFPFGTKGGFDFLDVDKACA